MRSDSTSAAVVPIVAGFAAFLLAAGLAGAMTPASSRALTAIALAAIAGWCSAVGARWARAFWIAPLLPFAAGLLAHDAGEPLAIAVVVAVLMTAAAATHGVAVHGVIMRVVARSVAVAALIDVATRHSPFAWRALDALSGTISRAAALITGEPLQIGPTLSGVWVAILFAAIVLPSSAYRIFQPKRSIAILLAAVILITIAYAALLGAMERLVIRLLGALLATPTPHQPFDVPPGQLAGPLVLVLLLVLTAPAVWFLSRLEERATETAPRRSLAIGGIALAVAGSIGIFWPAFITSAPGNRNILFRDDGTLEMSSPVPGRYGIIQSGMFGSLPKYLEAAGYRTRVARGPLTESDLRGTSVLSIINLQHAIAPAEREVIWNFVRRGGGLLVLGDHTDIFGIQRPLNDLLEPAGIRFEFDSAFALRRHWRFCQSYLPHAVTAGLIDQRDTQIGTGASLTFARGSGAQPVVVGRYAFSDLGNRANGGRGAFLGDYRYERGERLGDVILTAEAREGRGRVIVFGDTTSFQPPVLPYSYPFVERTFRYLAGGAPRSPWAVAMFAIVALAGLAIAFVSRPPVGAAMLIASVLVIGDGLASLRPPPDPLPLPPSRLAVVDLAHVEMLPPEDFEEGSMGGLLPTLMRSGYLPVVTRTSDPALLDRASLAVFVTPQRDPGKAMRDALERLLHRGGSVIVTGGAEYAGVPRDILSTCGMTIGAYPLGPAKATDELGHEVRFVDAWPVIARGSMRVWARSGNDVVAGETAVGAGRCIGIGDARFFEEKNFEGEYEYQQSALEFMARLLAPRGANG